MNVSNAGVNGINLSNISGMDIETALMMVQSERTKLLDSQLKSQIEEVQKRNEVTGALNDKMCIRDRGHTAPLRKRLRSA